MHCQEPLIRGASQCQILDILANSSNFSNLMLEDEDIFDGFKRLMHFTAPKGILIRGTNIWSKVVKWVCPKLQCTTYDIILDEVELKAQNTTAHKVQYQLAHLAGLVLVMWSDIENTKTAIIDIVDELWKRMLSTSKRPYSILGFEFYLYCLASILKIINPPLKRKGKDALFRFCDLNGKRELNIFSEFLLKNVSDVCNCLHRHFQTVDIENILYIDDVIMVLRELIIELNIHSKVFGHLRQSNVINGNMVVELLITMTKEYEEILKSEEKCTIPHILKKMSFMKVLGHDWWFKLCRCYRFSNLKKRNGRNKLSNIENHCSNCLLIGPLEFQARRKDLSCLHWPSNSTMSSFPSLNVIKTEQKDTEILNRNEQQLWGTLQCQFIASQWKCIRNGLLLNEFHAISDNKHALTSINITNEFSELRLNHEFPVKYTMFAENMVKEGLAAMFVGGLDVLVPVQNCVAYLTNQTASNEHTNIVDIQSAPAILQTIVNEIIPQAKIAVFDARKNEEFWPALEAFIEMSFGAKLLVYDDLLDQNLVLLRELFAMSETVTGIACLITKHLANITKCSTIHYKFANEAIALASLTGSIHKKDQSHYMKANQLIHNLGGEKIPANLIEGSDHCMSSDLKSYAVLMLVNVSNQRDNQREYHKELISAIVLQAQILIDNRDKHYFENSFTHIVLIRMHQVLLCVSKLPMQEDNVRELAHLALNRITNEPGHQLSVRYLCEWSVIILAFSNDQQFYHLVLTLVHEYFSTAKIFRPNCVPSYIVILSHVALITLNSGKHDEQFKIQLENTMDLISPWCMAQQFTTRLYAQIFFKRLYFKAMEMGITDIKNKYYVLNACVTESLNLGEKEKNSEKIMSDFYLTRFNPQINFNIENIFYDFPRLMNILPQEWAKHDAIQAKLFQGTF